ncbi:hypothetical protein D0Z07_6046 [Hyphodiscus hymeniophilus]|uniref:Myb-like DNA-binding domain-containing protein n=1 Tax=Hyphodiscus hymeniophilus TaxID=353542 RepID=A0A9P6VH40_9HELO|nr:hypothetical protein D0Z07_6046 [Hyphodiscus hymeniophilus]
MSDNENTGADGADVGGMTSVDVKFLITCLQNAAGGSISIDNTKVAEALNYKNPRSVANKIALLKKKYDLPLGTSGKGAGALTASPKTGTTPKDATVPKTPTKTPTKGRVTKPRVNSSTKKKPAPKTKVKAKAESDDEEGEEEKLQVESDGEIPCATQEDYDAVFGKPDSDEDEEVGEA